MTDYRLRTLGGVSLSGPNGSVPLEEPRLAALLVLLGVGGDAGVAESELLLRLTPELRPEKARAELGRLVALARTLLGGTATVAPTRDGYAFAGGAVEMDVLVLPVPAEHECAEFLVGFKLPGNPEFRDWLTATRLHVASRQTSYAAPPAQLTPPAPLSAARRTAFLVTAIAAFAAALAGAGWLVRPRPVQGLATGDPVLLADVRNETGDSLFGTGLLSAATLALQQSGKFRLYPRARLGEVYRLMQIANRDTALTFELAQEVAERDRVRFVLGLQVDRAGDGYRVTGRLADVLLRKPIIETSESARVKGDVLGALDRVLRTIRTRLGESRGELASRQLALPLVTTQSLEALRSFGDGSAAWTKGNYKLAAELWQRAVDIDTGFATAYGALGSLYYYTHDRAQGERYYAEALRRASRLTERERLRLLEGLAGYRGNLDSSLVLSKQLAIRYPSVTTWYNLGVNLMQGGQADSAIAAFKTALTYDSTHVNSYVNLATTSRRLNRDEQALRYYAQARRFDSASVYRNNVNHEWGGTLVSLGRLADAESAFRRMATGTSVDNRALGLRSLGFLALWRGRVDDAIDLFGQATDATVQAKAPLSEVRNRLLRASAFRVAGREREAGVEVTRTLTLMQSPLVEPRFLALVANSCLLLGRTADAETVLRLLRTRRDSASAVDRAAEAYVAGALSLARRHADSALAFARRAGALPQMILVAMVEAEAFRAMGQGDSARAALTRVMQDRGFGNEGQDDWLRAPLLLGDLLLAKGDTAGASKAYQRLVDQWKDAPRPLPDLTAARARLAGLSGARR